MAGVQHLLRKAAIEKMASPEQLDMAMRVTSPLSWLALATLGSARDERGGRECCRAAFGPRGR